MLIIEEPLKKNWRAYPLWHGSNGFPYAEDSVLANAPARSGVYALYERPNRWVYIGESDNIQASLLQHVRSGNTCVNEERPSLFAWELVAPEQRRMRRDQLIQEFRPVCEAA